MEGITVDIRKILCIVDGNENNLRVAKQAFKFHYRIYDVPSAAEMFSFLKAVVPDIILLDASMPGMSGVDALRELKADKKYRDIPVIVLADTPSVLAADDCFALGAVDYIARPVLPNVLLHRMDEHLRSSEIISRRDSRYQKLQSGVISVLAEIINHRDNPTGGHVMRTSEYMKILLDEMLRHGIYPDETRGWKMETLVPSARLHDVGKIGISDTILNKPGKLSADEFDIIKTHTVEGERIIEMMVMHAGGGAYLSHAGRFAACHHERWDGAGYPRGLSGTSIPLEGRILAVADVYDALVSERPYKKAFSAEEAEKIILEESGKQFDPRIVAVFFNVREEFRDVK